MNIAEEFKRKRFMNNRSAALSIIIMEWSEQGKSPVDSLSEKLAQLGPGKTVAGINIPQPVMDIVEKCQKDHRIVSRSTALSLIIWEWSQLNNIKVP